MVTGIDLCIYQIWEAENFVKNIKPSRNPTPHLPIYRQIVLQINWAISAPQNYKTMTTKNRLHV